MCDKNNALLMLVVEIAKIDAVNLKYSLSDFHSMYNIPVYEIDLSDNGVLQCGRCVWEILMCLCKTVWRFDSF